MRQEDGNRSNPAAWIVARTYVRVAATCKFAERKAHGLSRRETLKRDIREVAKSASENFDQIGRAHV